MKYCKNTQSHPQCVKCGLRRLDHYYVYGLNNEPLCAPCLCDEYLRLKQEFAETRVGDKKGIVMSETMDSELLTEAEDLLREVWVQYRMERRVKGVMQGYSAGSMQTMEQVQDYLLKRGQINKDGYFE